MLRTEAYDVVIFRSDLDNKKAKTASGKCIYVKKQHLLSFNI